MAFLKSLFLVGITAQGSDFFSTYLVHSIWMMLFSLVVAYLVLMTLVMTGLYTRPESMREIADSETRVKLCAGWAISGVLLLLLGLLGWIYYNGLLQPQADVWLYFRPLAAHLTTVALLFVVWVFVYWGIHKEIKSSQAFLR